MRILRRTFIPLSCLFSSIETHTNFCHLFHMSGTSATTLACLSRFTPSSACSSATPFPINQYPPEHMGFKEFQRCSIGAHTKFCHLLLLLKSCIDFSTRLWGSAYSWIHSGFLGSFACKLFWNFDHKEVLQYFFSSSLTLPDLVLNLMNYSCKVSHSISFILARVATSGAYWRVDLNVLKKRSSNYYQELIVAA